MVQESFIYSFVARGTVVLAESNTEFAGNFREIALQRLRELPPSANRFTYNYDHHTFTFLLEDDYAYCVVANESVGTQLSIAFLDNIKTDFKKRHGAVESRGVWIMKEQMQYTVSHAGEIEKQQKVRAQVSEEKNVMYENIVKAFEKDRSINLPYKVDELRGSPQVFRVAVNRTHHKKWWQNTKLKLGAIGIVILLVLIRLIIFTINFNMFTPTV